MRRMIVAVVLVALVLVSAVPPAHAGAATDIALGLASFAVFNQIVAPLLRPPYAEAHYHRHVVVTPAPVVYRQTVVHPAPVVYQPPPVVYQPPTPTTVVYPHGRYELQVHGHRYVWVWIPATPPPPPPPPAAGAPTPTATP